MSEHRLRYIHGFQSRNILSAELQFERADGVIQMMRLRGTDDGGCQAGLVQQPGERHLAGLGLEALGDRIDRIDDLVVLWTAESGGI